MFRKIFSSILVLAVIFSLTPHSAYATGVKEGAASLFLPTTGQAMNGELGNGKTKLMAGVEVASIATIAVLGIVTGGAAVWIGLGPLAANHLWSSADAYKGAKKKQQRFAREGLT